MRTTRENQSFKVRSRAFSNNEEIPGDFTCDGEDISPPFEWGDPPAGTESFALVIDDPDAPRGTWTHWLVYNIPATVREFNEGTLPAGALEGVNDWFTTSYRGPCPPSGRHHYHVKLYALDTTLDELDLPARVDLDAAMKNHILAETELVGTYKSRPPERRH